MRYDPTRACGKMLNRAVLAWFGLVAAACANYAAPLETARPIPASPTRITEELRSLPAPKEQVVAAVYRFRDETGQYKAAENMASWSTAVTQGATSILIKALEESGWFVPIEREGLSNLLNERQIIQSIRAQYEGPEGQKLGPLPPLLYAGIILEGGIVGYDTNLLTGGVGVRYFGAGGSGKFRQDQVTVYLRAVSTQTGRVLRTVTTSKTIASQQVDAGIFRFVDVDRLLESEVGYSYNEPPVVAVTEAIQEAVKELVIEGVKEGLWALEDPAEIHGPAFAGYERSKVAAAGIGPYGLRNDRDRSGFSLSVEGGARQYQGNYRNALVRPAGGLSLRWMPTSRWGLGLSAYGGDIGVEGGFQWTAVSVGLDATYFLLPHATTSPFLRVGAGVLKPNVESQLGDFGEQLFPVATLGGGIERLLSPSVGVSLGLFNQYALMDGIDGVKTGHGNDSVWNLTLGLTFY